MDLIFLGNSYTFQNDLNLVVESIFEQSDAIYAETSTVRLSDGGLTWEDHVERTTSNELWKDALVTGTATYNWGILQK